MSQPQCPKCGTILALNPDSGMFNCPKCGFRRPESLDEAAERLRARGQRPDVSLTSRVPVDYRARTVFETGQDDLWRGDKAAALAAFQDALEIQPDFVDAHLWIAKTSPDPNVQRDQLGEVLAVDPGHAEALRMLMVLNGQLTPEEAERSKTESGPVLRHADAPVRTQITNLKCPVCGGDLTIDEANGRVVCKFCGHTEPLDPHRHAGAQIFGAAMIKQRGQAVKWVVGARILHCNQCGAERTLPAGKLSTVCPFCGSTQVLQQDALNTIDQPDGLVSFTVTEEQAKAAIHERLRSFGERIGGLLDDNRIKSATIEGMYLPFWVFDALVEVSRTIFDRRTPTSRDAVRLFQPYENSKLNDGMNGVTVAAVKSPPASLTAQLGQFDIGSASAYEPNLLAKYPASLYDVNFDDASLDAQSIISQHMRERYGQGGSTNVEVQIFTSVIQMTFTLLLLPVWVGTLYERDGGVRSALVNGQTGQVALGKSQKPA
jgi:uncharacterized Zn finger protein (UPF0148 family)